MSTSKWTTRIAPEITRTYGVEELHTLWFTPQGWPGEGPIINLGIPECELQQCTFMNGVPVILRNRPPQADLNVHYWIRTACKLAVERGAAVIFICNTVAQADETAKAAAPLLPKYRRAALERMYDAAARGNLS